LKHRFGIVLWPALAAMSFAAFLAPSAASAGTWSPIEPVPGFSGSRPNDLSQIPASDGSRLLYWTREVSGSDRVQAMRMAADGSLDTIVDVVDFGAEGGQDLSVVMDAEGEATFGWRSTSVPDGVIRSRSLAPDNTLGPITDISPAGDPGETVQGLSMAVLIDGTVGYTWRRNSVVWRVEGVTVPDNGPVGTVRSYTDAPFSVTADPRIAALPGNRFKLAWIPLDVDTGFWNVAITDIQSDGAPVTPTPTFLFPRTVPVNGVVGNFCQQLRDPDTNQPLTEDSGATGNPRNLELGANADGAVSIAWRRFVQNGTKTCEGDIPVVESQQVSVETVTISTVGIQTAVKQVSAGGLEVQRLEMQMPRTGRNTLTWFAEDDGSFSTQIFRFSDSGVWTLSTDDNWVDPTVIAGSNLSVGVGWTEGGDTPTQGTARAAFLSRNGQLVPADFPGLGDLKASSEPLAVPDPQGEHTVTFYGLDQADVGGFWRSSFSDPGIKVSPGIVNFGDSLIGTSSGDFRLFIQNNGTTPNPVTAIGLAGADASQFKILNAADCQVTIAPGGFCAVRIRFSPGSAGLKTADVTVTSDGGVVVSQLRGRGVARTRLGLGSKPVRRAVRPGGRAVFSASVSNRGGINATGVRVCLNAPGRRVTPGRICRTIASISPGNSRTVRFTVRSARSAASGNYALVFRSSASNARAVRSAATLRVKG
jgi:hypothetical protein